MNYNLSKRQIEIIIMLLNCDGFLSSFNLGQYLKLSEKTIRSEIKEINAGDSIISVQKGKGYFISNKEACKKIIHNNENKDGKRELLILKEVLSNKNIDYYSIVDNFYISESTLNKDIKLLNNKIETRFSGLKINRKNNQLFINCNDDQKRKVLTYFLLDEIDSNSFNISNLYSYFKNIDIAKLKDIIIEYLSSRNIKFLDYSLISLLLDITIIVDQILNGNMDRPVSSFRKLQDSEKKYKCYNLCLKIENLINMSVSIENVENIEFLFETRIKDLSKDKEYASYISFLDTILSDVSDSYNINFKDYDELKNNLAIHLKRLEIRCKENVFLKNPFLTEIKRNFTLVYDIGVYLSMKFQDLTGYWISEDEIGYIALDILGALEKFKLYPIKIAIINPYSPAINRFIESKLSDKLFDIEIIGNYSIFDYKKIYANKPDLIITLVNINEKFNIPICKVDSYMLEENFHSIESMINDIKFNKLFGNFKIRNYFSEKLFFNKLNFSVKNEVLEFMCNKLYQLGYVESDFIDYVNIREEIASTNFGGLYAIPHPIKKIAKKNGIAVAILKEPILWGNSKVRLILLFALHSSFDQIPKLYDILLTALDDSCTFENIINVKSFNEFIKILMPNEV